MGKEKNAEECTEPVPDPEPETKRYRTRSGKAKTQPWNTPAKSIQEFEQFIEDHTDASKTKVCSLKLRTAPERIPMWIDANKAYFSESRESETGYKFTWKNTDMQLSVTDPSKSGDSIKVLTIHFYHTGTILLHGKGSKWYVESIFPQVKEAVNELVCESLRQDGGHDNEQSAPGGTGTIDNNVETMETGSGDEASAMTVADNDCQESNGDPNQTTTPKPNTADPTEEKNRKKEVAEQAQHIEELKSELQRQRDIAAGLTETLASQRADHEALQAQVVLLTNQAQSDGTLTRHRCSDSQTVNSRIQRLYSEIVTGAENSTDTQKPPGTTVTRTLENPAPQAPMNPATQTPTNPATRAPASPATQTPANPTSNPAIRAPVNPPTQTEGNRAKSASIQNARVEKTCLKDKKLIYVRHRLLSEDRTLYKPDGIHIRPDTGVRLMVADVKRTLRHHEETTASRQRWNPDRQHTRPARETMSMRSSGQYTTTPHSQLGLFPGAPREPPFSWNSAPAPRPPPQWNNWNRQAGPMWAEPETQDKRQPRGTRCHMGLVIFQVFSIKCGIILYLQQDAETKQPAP
uniref:Uncharacterized protein n=1 Tax=Branchiostoma floridae TaxID=7739 RepID=C3Z197_BRAFL|eukprot:XP_002597784.1 hypothetical protein BRAFLDRAFT_121657 [Branchiostoma floridae]